MRLFKPVALDEPNACATCLGSTKPTATDHFSPRRKKHHSLQHTSFWGKVIAVSIISKLIRLGLSDRIHTSTPTKQNREVNSGKIKA